MRFLHMTCELYWLIHTADARLRIVSERVDFIDNLIISVSVILFNYMCFHSLTIIYLVFCLRRLLGTSFDFQIAPPNPVFLKSKDKSTWSAKDVADSVLADKSALVFCLSCSICVSLVWQFGMKFYSLWQRVTSSQRMDESSVLDAHSSTVSSANCVELLLE